MNTTKEKNNRNWKRVSKNNNGGRRRISGKKQVSTLDPSLLIKKATLADKDEAKEFVPTQAFNKWPIDISLKANLSVMNFEYPSQIQEQTYSHLIGGSDLIGIAKTGTGKTAAFLIPLIQQLLDSNKAFNTLIVVPTRELAIQVEAEFRRLSKGIGLYSSCFIGGTNISKDISNLKRRNHFIIGTPGRLLDLSNRGNLRLKEYSKLILDEFDRMLDMGFKRDILKLLDRMINRKQTILFSATTDKSQKSLINSILQEPREIRISSGETSSDQVDQDIVKVPRGMEKFDVLLNMLNQKEFDKVLIFAETKRLTNKISKKLNSSGISSDEIHGNKSQSYRNNALSRFKTGNVKVLVATDIAARGIDVENVSHVINYQLPMNLDSYIHRIGRTGRAGKFGKAFTFVD